MSDRSRFSITFLAEQIACVAELLPDLAPATCREFLAALPLRLTGVHAMFTGREISLQLPNAGPVPPENQTCFPLPGDLLWTSVPPYVWNGIPRPIQDVGIFYGRDCRTLMPIGWVPGNRFAAIVENLAPFAEVCARCQREGAKELRFELLNR
ncbi:MAG: DUF3830 family protein [Chloroflexota bacterium]